MTEVFRIVKIVIFMMFIVAFNKKVLLLELFFRYLVFLWSESFRHKWHNVFFCLSAIVSDFVIKKSSDGKDWFSNISALVIEMMKNYKLDIWLSSKSLKRCFSVSVTFLGQIREIISLLRCPWFSALKLSLLFSFKLPSSMTRCVSKPLFWHSVRIAFTIQDWYVFFMPKFNNAHQAHWTDLLGAMCILLAVTGMGFESKVIQN